MQSIMKLGLSILLVIVALSAQAADTIGKINQTISDTAITTKVLYKYTRNPLLSPFKVRVSTKRGKVKLKGRVDTDIQYEKAIELAQQIKGVKSVDASELEVEKSARPLKDAYLTGKVKGLLVLNGLLTLNAAGKLNLDIVVKNQIAYVSGQVSSKENKQKILQLIKTTDGIASVKSDIKVEE